MEDEEGVGNVGGSKFKHVGNVGDIGSTKLKHVEDVVDVGNAGGSNAEARGCWWV